MQTGAENPDAKVAAVRAIFDRNGIPELIETEKTHYQEAAFRHLDEVQAPEERKTVLRGSLEALFERDR
jgi:hypothetical protein